MTSWNIAHSTARSLAIVQLAALSHQACILSLSPVYGSIPSSAAFGHTILMPLACLAMVVSRDFLPDFTEIVPVLGYLAPVTQSILYTYSGRLGPYWGPIVNYATISFPLTLLTLLSAIGPLVETVLRKPNVEGVSNSILITGSLGVLKGCIMVGTLKQFVTVFDWTATSFLTKLNLTTSVMFSRFGLQIMIALLWTALTRSKKLFLLGFLSLVHVIFFVPHIPSVRNSASINHTLLPLGYSLVARQESVTGYISILDNVKDGFRVMRCDHSLLGGEWTNKPEGHPAKFNEPIYSIFVMLEAVRLVETPSSPVLTDTLDPEKQALVIGLGVGTAPSALIAHGVRTTIVEIDPVVHQFATQYFSLPSSHMPIIGDAVKVVDEMQNDTAQSKFDYIIHDVFTGGAEPIDLFTYEFLNGLNNLLSAEGTIAVNYGGDLLLPSAISVITTVLSIFPNCRIFREVPTPVPMGKEDFTNLVIFCRKTTEVFGFRSPNEADLLGSPARRQHLLPQNEVTDAKQMVGDKGQIIRRGQTKWLEASQMQSAIGHWRLMRKVLPDIVWETW